MKAPQLGPRVDAFLRALADRRDLLKRVEVWGNFPAKMRPYFLAQRGKCPYCGQPIDPKASLRARNKARWTWDHVHPKSRSGRYMARNKVVAHSPCNNRKADRLPLPCEVLFLAIVNDIVDQLRGR